MDTIKTQALAAIDEERGNLVQLSDYLHAHPEVGFQECLASEALMDFLSARGFTVEKGIGDMATAFRARIGADEPTVALVAEYDALPDIGHGCGHNLIATGAMGAALGLAAVISHLDGTVVVMGTPAEECLYDIPGKVRLLEAGAFDGVDAAIMFHPWTSTALLRGDRGLVSLEVAFHGRPAHAAADPWNGANALDGVMLAFNAINALRQQLKPEARIHGKITHGGDVPNIIHAFASALITVRAESHAYLHETVVPRVESCIRGAAMATGTEVEIKRISPIDSTLSNPVLARTVATAAKDLGIALEEPVFMGGSTDFGNLSRAVPATYFLADIGLEPGAAWHSKEVAAAAKTGYAHRSMLDAARIMALTVIDLLTHPSLLEEAKEEFAQATG